MKERFCDPAELAGSSRSMQLYLASAAERTSASPLALQTGRMRKTGGDPVPPATEDEDEDKSPLKDWIMNERDFLPVNH